MPNWEWSQYQQKIHIFWDNKNPNIKYYPKLLKNWGNSIKVTK